MDPVSTQETPPENAITPSESAFKEDSLLDRLKSTIPNVEQFAKNVLLPVTVVAGVFLVGVGGTYVIASNVLNPAGGLPGPSKISSSDLAAAPVVSLPIPTSTPELTAATPTPTDVVASVSATPTPDPAKGWTPYSFGVLKLNFSYPPGWFITVPQTSGAPYLYVQNFSGNLPAKYTPGQFSLLISRLEQVGITTINALTTQLALNAASNITLNGVNMGQVSVISSVPTTINGYQALQRIVTYSSSPSAQMSETYILDGVSNVIEFVPLLDTSYGASYFNTLLSTVKFTK